jgi:apolipoprotein N-acyltransferase
LIVLAILMGLFCAAARVPPLQNTSRPTRGLKVAGIQLEFSTEKEVLRWLNELARVHPEAELLVLSEYTLSEPPSEALKAWCRGHRRFLIVGGKDPVSNGNFYNTAFVISPEGEIAFRQVKCVPIQFFKDGLPAPEQKLWDSPWGKLGICICYDLSYARVTDPLIRMGAEGLIVPTMDVADWGKRQHEMHARVGPIRAAEYRLPIFRLASSGISQAIDPAGKVLATAPCPGNTSMLAATLPLTDSARRPIDRWLAPLSTGIAGALLLATLIPSGVLSRKLPPAC